MGTPFFVILHYILFVLETSIPSLRTIIVFVPLELPLAMNDTRDSACSSPGRGNNHIDSLMPPATMKISEIWARFGSIHIVSPSRCKRIKRVWHRACRRAVRESHIVYHGRILWAHDIPMRFRVFQPVAPTSRPRLSAHCRAPTETAPQFFHGMLAMVFYEEWLFWIDRCGFHILLIQEIEWTHSKCLFWRFESVQPKRITPFSSLTTFDSAASHRATQSNCISCHHPWTIIIFAVEFEENIWYISICM